MSPYAWGTDLSLSLNLTTFQVADKMNLCLSDVIDPVSRS